jgi:hypothetical protein
LCIAAQFPNITDRKAVAMMQSFEDAGKFGKDVMDTQLKSLAAMSKGVQSITVEATEYSKKSYEQGSTMMEKLFSAKSLDKVFEIQTDYAKQAYEGMVAQATKMGELYSEMAKDVYKPFETMVTKAK